MCGRRAVVLECGAGGGLEVRQAYADADAGEELYACAWSRDEQARGGREGAARGATPRPHPPTPPPPQTNHPLLLVAGKCGVLRVLDASTGTLVWSGVGHGDAVNDVAVHPARPALALTASKDHAVRVWRLDAQLCAGVAVGDGSHRSEVLSVDWHPTDPSLFASAGMDSVVNVWRLGAGGGSGGAGPVSPLCAVLPVPELTARALHAGCVIDCVRWVGPAALASKGTDDRVVLWSAPGLAARAGARLPAAAAAASAAAAAARPDHGAAASTAGAPGGADADARVLARLETTGAAAVWFVRFALDAAATVLAAGSTEGGVLLFDPRSTDGAPRAALTCAPPDGAPEPGGTGPGTVRQTALSADGSILLAGCDGGTLWRWDRVADGA